MLSGLKNCSGMASFCEPHDGRIFGREEMAAVGPHCNGWGDIRPSSPIWRNGPGVRAAFHRDWRESATDQLWRVFGKHPPTHVVEIWDNRSWSCPHGVGRWSEDCGCSTGAHPGWKQEWRAPLRSALNWLRDCLGKIYEADAAALLKNPWAARNDYIDVILERSHESVECFLRLTGSGS